MVVVVVEVVDVVYVVVDAVVVVVEVVVVVVVVVVRDTNTKIKTTIVFTGSSSETIVGGWGGDAQNIGSL